MEERVGNIMRWSCFGLVGGREAACDVICEEKLPGQELNQSGRVQ